MILFFCKQKCTWNYYARKEIALVFSSVFINDVIKCIIIYTFAIVKCI